MNKTVLPFLLGSFFFFLPCPSQLLKKHFGHTRAAWDILVSQPGIELVPPVVEAQSLNHWATRELPQATFWVVCPDPTSPTSPAVGIVRLWNSGGFPESRYPVLLQQHRWHQNQLLPTAPCWARNWTEPHRTQSTGQAIHKLPMSWGSRGTFLAGRLAPAPHPHPTRWIKARKSLPGCCC